MLFGMSDLKPVYLLAGTDRPKITRALRRLRNRVGEDAVEHLDAAETSGEDAVAACNAMGLFASGGRLVLIDGVERWKAADADAVAGYVSSPAPGTILALVGSELKKDAPLAKAVVKAGDLLLFDTPKRDLSGWVGEQFVLLGAQADRDACRTLVSLVGDDVQALTSEVAKLAAWAAGEPIRSEDVERLTAARAETPPFALTDAWGRRDVGALLEAAEGLLERGDDPIRLVALLANHVGRVRNCRKLDAEGVSPREAAGRLKMHPFAAEKAFGHARNYGNEELRAATVRLAETDVALKGGSRLDGELVLERALIEITQPAETPTAARAQP
jgi:DNA polymerase III subunit delta